MCKKEVRERKGGPLPSYSKKNGWGDIPLPNKKSLLDGWEPKIYDLCLPLSSVSYVSVEFLVEIKIAILWGANWDTFLSYNNIIYYQAHISRVLQIS